jgi:hypothetical protein
MSIKSIIEKLVENGPSALSMDEKRRLAKAIVDEEVEDNKDAKYMIKTDRTKDEIDNLVEKVGREKAIEIIARNFDCIDETGIKKIETEDIKLYFYQLMKY